MSRIRMFEGDEPGETPSPRTTIVGGRPPEAAGASFPVPVGLQRLLRLAAVEAAFLEELVVKRAEVAGPAGVELTPSERAILEAAPEEQLRAMARAVPPPEPTRRDFLRKTAATAVVLLGGAAIEGCPGSGAAPDAAAPEPPPPPRPDTPGLPTGIAPDLPPPRPDSRAMDTEGGAAPDEPPPRPGRVPSPPGGARPDPPPPRPDAGQDGGFAEPPPGWEGGAPDGGQPGAAEERPPRPDIPHATRGIRPR